MTTDWGATNRAKVANFRAWLTDKRKCRAGTIRVYTTALERARQKIFAYAPPEHDRAALRAYTRYLDLVQPEEDARDNMIRDWAESPPVAIRRGRAHREGVRPFSDADWHKLTAALMVDPEPEARALEIQCYTGLRTGDVLRLRRDDFSRAHTGDAIVQLESKGGRFRKIPLYGLPEMWARLAEQWADGDTLADWISPGSRNPDAGAAYLAVRKHLQHVAANLELEGRIHLHRLRHTFAHQVMQVTGDVHLLSRALGHQSLQTTMRYLSEEARANELAKIYEQINKRRDNI